VTCAQWQDGTAGLASVWYGKGTAVTTAAIPERRALRDPVGARSAGHHSRLTRCRGVYIKELLAKNAGGSTLGGYYAHDAANPAVAARTLAGTVPRSTMPPGQEGAASS
jgi:hypothetical protein